MTSRDAEAANRPIKYEDRYIVFLDFLGFEELLDKTSSDPTRLDDLYDLLSAVTSGNLLDVAYGGIPTLALDGTQQLKPASSLPDAPRSDFLSRAKTSWPINITHFSDCFVISAPASNASSCRMVHELVTGIVRAFIGNAVVLRGGAAVGSLIHEHDGPLFGSAMVEAHFLESKKAQWPRIMMCERTALFLRSQVFDGSENLNNSIQQAEDGLFQITPASCFAMKRIPADDPSVEKVSQIIKALVREHAADTKKLGPRYVALHEDWLSTYGQPLAE